MVCNYYGCLAVLDALITTLVLRCRRCLPGLFGCEWSLDLGDCVLVSLLGFDTVVMFVFGCGIDALHACVWSTRLVVCALV